MKAVTGAKLECKRMQTVISTIAIGGEDSSAAMMSFSVPLVTLVHIFKT